MLDTLYRIETPEGVFIRFSVAGPMSRFFAFMIDLSIRGTLYFFGAMFFQFFEEVGYGLMFLVFFLVEWFYPVLFEMFNHGRTPGKQCLGLVVILDDGSPLQWHSSLLRNLLRNIDVLPFGYGFGLICCACNSRFQRIGDLVAGTLVVYQKGELPTYALIPEVPARPPRVPLQLQEQRAVMAFAERSLKLSRERTIELAEVLEPYTGATDQPGVDELLGNARWFAGRRT